MDKNSLLSILTNVELLCKEVASFIRAEINKVTPDDIQSKEMNSLVSYVDQEAEKQIVRGLSMILPEAGYITEEETTNELDKNFTWIVDPLDGTSNFLNKIPHFSISVALLEGEEIVLGVVFDIMRNESFTAVKNHGFYINGIHSKIGTSKNISDAIVVTGFPYNKHKLFQPTFDVMKYFLQHGRGFRRLGSAALDLAYIAAGRLDIYYEANINAWDVAAGIILVTEAGGEVCDFNQEQNMLGRGEIIATNKHLINSVSLLIKETFHK